MVRFHFRCLLIYLDVRAFDCYPLDSGIRLGKSNIESNLERYYFWWSHCIPSGFLDCYPIESGIYLGKRKQWSNLRRDFTSDDRSFVSIVRALDCYPLDSECFYEKIPSDSSFHFIEQARIVSPWKLKIHIPPRDPNYPPENWNSALRNSNFLPKVRNIWPNTWPQ